MWQKISIGAGVGVLALLSACGAEIVGSGRLKTETRAVADVHEVEVEGIGELTITQGEPESLVIEAEDNLLAAVESPVRHGKLALKERGSLRVTKPLRFHLTVKALQKLSLQGSATARLEKFSTPGNFVVHISGSGDVDIPELTCTAFKLQLSGSGGAKVAGAAKQQDVEISGSANYRAPAFKTEKARVTISGAGDATVCATASLRADISGSGRVQYRGQPTVSKQISGAGEVSAQGPEE